MRFAGNEFQHRQAVARKSEAFKPVNHGTPVRSLSAGAWSARGAERICADVRPDWSPHVNKRHV